MKFITAFLVALLVAIAQSLPNEKVLDLTHAPTLKPTEGSGRSVNLSFFIPALSMMAWASQYMPQFLPTFTTTTSSRRRRQRQERSVPADSSDNNNLNWIEEFIRNGIVY